MPELFRVHTDRALLTWSEVGSSCSRAYAGPAPLPGRLWIHPQRAGLKFQDETWRAGVPPEVASDPEQSVGPHLFEETNYGVFLRSLSGEHVEIRHRDPVLVRRLQESDGGAVVHGILNFRSQVGRSQFGVIVDGVPEFDFEVEVFPSKLDYVADYQQLVADVQDILTGLVVEYLRATFATGLPVRAPQPAHVEWLTLLRHVIDDLERALGYVAQRPRWGLARADEAVRVERLRRADGAVRRAVLRGRGSGRLRPLTDRITVREWLRERRARPTLDTPEHRWLAAQLARIRRRLVDLREEECRRERVLRDRGREPAFERVHRVLGELDGMERRVARLERLEPFAATTEPPTAGFASLQLVASPGYGEAYRSLMILSLGLRISGGPVGLSLKDLHELYEYWCYLAVLRLASEMVGQPLPVRELLVPEQQGLRVRIRKGRARSVVFSGRSGRKLEVTYNPRFGGELFVTPQQPDIMLTVDDPDWPSVRLVLDAKYRLDTSPEYLERHGFPGPPDDAVNVLHRYRDAILEYDGEGASSSPKRTVVQGAVLFPLRPGSPGEFKGSRLWTALERVGIGALPFLPGDTDYVREWLEQLFTSGGWSLADRAIPHRAQDRAWNWRVAAAEPVLVGVLRKDNPQEHLEWLIRERLYYTPIVKTQLRQWATRWVAIYSPTALRRPGAVTHVAPVIDMHVKPRSEIATPWQAKRGHAELQAVYRLGPVQQQPSPIENRGPNGRGTRFSDNRWTSRLALLRARELRELFLETEPEWRLLEDLRAAGIAFQIRPGPVRLVDPEDPAGRATFVTRFGTVQYRGSGGFVWRRVDAEERWFARSSDVVAALLNVVRMAATGESPE